MRRNDRKLFYSKKEKVIIWKDYMERMKNDENDWNHMERDAVKYPVNYVNRDGVKQVLNVMKTGKALGHLDVS